MGRSLQLCLVRCSNLPSLGLSVVLGDVLNAGNKVVSEMGEVLALLLFMAPPPPSSHPAASQRAPGTGELGRLFGFPADEL